MNAASLASLTWGVLMMAFALAFALGALLQTSRFCTMGAISDWVLMQESTRLRQWAVAAAVSILGFAAMQSSGWISASNTIYASPKLLWLSALVGGFSFGVGMVLASGCSSQTLVRLGGGNLKSLIVLLVMAVFALATWRGLLGVWRVNTLEAVVAPAQGLGFAGEWWAQRSGHSVPVASAASAACAAGALLLWAGQDRDFRWSAAMWCGVGVGVLVTAMWWVTGVFGHGLEHPETLEEFYTATASGRMESFSFTLPMAQWLDAFLYFSDGTKKLSVGMVSTLGLLLGSLTLALWRGTFRWESFTHRQDLLRHVVGGALMGLGGVIAMGCTMGQGLSGVSTLSFMSILTLLSMGLGAWASLKWQLSRA